MSAEGTAVSIGGIDLSLVRKRIRHVNLRVYPPDGRVRVTAPLRMPEEAVRLAVLEKRKWIAKQQAEIRARPREVPPAYLTGESHVLFGRSHALSVVVGRGARGAAIDESGGITLMIREGDSADTREKVLGRWRTEQLAGLCGPLIEAWAGVLGVSARAWSIRRMRTRWGSCSPRTRRITLALSLAEQPPPCVEYVVVHELAHLLEGGHGPRFAALMDRHLPSWRVRRAELAASPAATGAAGR